VQNPFDPAQLQLMNSRIAPLWTADGQSPFLLGTDEQGRDVFSAILYGLRISLTVGVLGVLFSGTLGILLGLIAGYFGGAIDSLIMRIADVQLTFPAILIALLVNGVVKSVFGNRLDAMSTLAVLVFAIGLSFWVQYARTVRGSVMVEKNKDYVAAAQLIGLPAPVIMLRHVLPNTMGPILVIATINLALAVITEATLVVSRRRHARHHAVARHLDPDRQQLSVFRRMVDRRLPGPCAGGIDPLHQPARRLAARRAQSEASMRLAATQQLLSGISDRMIEPVAFGAQPRGEIRHPPQRAARARRHLLRHRARARCWAWSANPAPANPSPASRSSA
jgi:ABC-type amino acid transport system permease subunit